MRLMIDAPGALTTVQDLGRTGVAHLGFCTCGAMDLTSMQIANRLVGNCRGCAVLEMTLTGISARFVGEGYFALAGGDFAPTLNGKPIENYRAYGVRSGDRLQLGAARTGLRCYLALSGGIDVPVVLGSRSTDLKIQMGGLDGRALQAGDVLTTGTPLATRAGKVMKVPPPATAFSMPPKNPALSMIKVSLISHCPAAVLRHA